jgi:hypothetical protein
MYNFISTMPETSTSVWCIEVMFKQSCHYWKIYYISFAKEKQFIFSQRKTSHISAKPQEMRRKQISNYTGNF